MFRYVGHVMKTQQETTHTPGPWFYNPYRFLIGQQDPTLPNDIKKLPVALLALVHSIGETTLADANLMAAAPEMLAALKSIIEWQDCPVTRPEAKELLIRNTARAAIAKAEKP